MVSISTRETKVDVASLTSSGEEEFTFAADTGAPLTSKTRSSKQYLNSMCWLKGYNPQFCVLMITKYMKLFGTNQVQECISGFKKV